MRALLKDFPNYVENNPLNLFCVRRKPRTTLQPPSGMPSINALHVPVAFVVLSLAAHPVCHICSFSHVQGSSRRVWSPSSLSVNYNGTARTVEGRFSPRTIAVLGIQCPSACRPPQRLTWSGGIYICSRCPYQGLRPCRREHISREGGHKAGAEQRVGR